MNWQFKLINPKQQFSIRHYAEHVVEEVREFVDSVSEEERTLEVIDVLHSAETLVRKYFEANPHLDVDEYVKKVSDKNERRGYYKL